MPDTVRVVDEQASTTLVYRVSGLQEKADFLELYSDNAKLDHCGLTKGPLVDKQEYERSEGRLEAVVIRGKSLEVLYTNLPSEAIEPDHARLRLEN